MSYKDRYTEDVLVWRVSMSPTRMSKAAAKIKVVISSSLQTE